MHRRFDRACPDLRPYDRVRSAPGQSLHIHGGHATSALPPTGTKPSAKAIGPGTHRDDRGDAETLAQPYTYSPNRKACCRPLLWRRSPLRGRRALRFRGGDVSRSRQTIEVGNDRKSAASFDDLVGGGEHFIGNVETKRLRGLEIDDQFVLGRRLNWQVGRLLAFKDAIDITSRAFVLVNRVRSLGGEAPVRWVVAVWKDVR
jgi:hypothetical protein